MGNVQGQNGSVRGIWGAWERAGDDPGAVPRNTMTVGYDADKADDPASEGTVEPKQTDEVLCSEKRAEVLRAAAPQATGFKRLTIGPAFSF